jgi:hypothetical protein
LAAATLAAIVQAEEKPGQLRLVDTLDRPMDGYCLDALGSGRHIRFDMPLIGHNCKPGLYADEAVVMKANGNIVFPAYRKCVTVAGVNATALPGSALMMQDCGELSPFINGPEMQRFKHRDDGRIQLVGSDLCMMVGRASAETYSPDHRWRSLSMETCDIAEPARSVWRFSVF